MCQARARDSSILLRERYLTEIEENIGGSGKIIRVLRLDEVPERLAVETARCLRG